MADDQVLNGDQRDEDDEADDVVAADNKLSESFDDAARSRGPFTAVQQDAARRGKVERKAHQCEQKNQARKDRELDRTKNLDRGQQHQH